MRSDDNLQKRFAKEDIDARVYGSMPGVLDTNTEVDGKKVLRSHSFSKSLPQSNWSRSWDRLNFSMLQPGIIGG